MILFSLSDRSGGSRGQCPLVRELRHNIRLGFVGFLKFTIVPESIGGKFLKFCSIVPILNFRSIIGNFCL